MARSIKQTVEELRHPGMVVMGVFDEASHAERAVSRLAALGIVPDDVSMVAHPSSVRVEHRQHALDKAMHSGAVAGTAALSATLVGIGLFAVPLGAVLVAGPIALLGGAAAAFGAPLFSPDTLSDLGVPREDAKLAIEAVRRGGVVVIAHVDERRARAVADALDRAGAIDLRARAAEWEAEGWTFEPNAPIWEAEQIAAERTLHRPTRRAPRPSAPSFG